MRIFSTRLHKTHHKRLPVTASHLLTFALAAIVILTLACGTKQPRATARTPYLVVLGIAQDGGFPQTGCGKACCQLAWRDPSMRRHVASLALVDPVTGKRWLIDATPDFCEQLRRLDEIAPVVEPAPGLAGIFLTHGHIGHYTGLMALGREVIGANKVPVYAMPRMQHFLSTAGPWEQLVTLQNITLRPMSASTPVLLDSTLRVIPFLVPHRDEYTETVGFRISGSQRSAIFIPDIDKWEKWATPIDEVIASADVVYLDGTFFANGEIPGRDMTEIPHPFIVETMSRLAGLPAAEKQKVRFIHLNHTNPALAPNSTATRSITKAGFQVAKEGERFDL